MNVIGIDATKLKCPEFTTPVMRLIKANIYDGKIGVIKATEPRSFNRIKHLCLSFDWQLLEQKEENGFYYSAVKCD